MVKNDHVDTLESEGLDLYLIPLKKIKEI